MNPTAESTIDIVDAADEDLVLPVLERDRRWAGYALCDLDPPHRAHARYVVAVQDGRPTATVLVYSPPDFTSLQPCGGPAGVRAILDRIGDLPGASYLLVRGVDLPAVAARYTVESAWTMLRMAVSAEALRPAPAVEAEISALNAEDLPAVQELYTLYVGTVFTQFMFEHGTYFGAHIGKQLVAVAGTHASSPRHRIGVIGNVFTQPAHRGRGLGTAVTGAVARALMRRGIEDVVLNVKEDNLPAVASYRKLGFRVHEPFWEGRARIRQREDGA